MFIIILFHIIWNGHKLNGEENR